MPKLSIMTMAFGGLLSKDRLSDVEMLDALDEMGFDGVELYTNRLFAQPGLLDVYRSYLAESGLEVPCIDVGCNFIGPDQASRDQGIQALRMGIEAAALLEAPLALAAGSHLSAGITPDDGRRMTADGLRACLPEAKAAGVTLAIEDFGVAPTLQCAAADCLAVLDAAPGTAFVFDTGNFYFAGEEPLANFEALAPLTRHLHLKDWVKSDKPQIADVSGTFLGEGLIPNQEVVRRFLDAGKVEWFSIELGAPGERLEAAGKDLATVRAWLS